MSVLRRRIMAQGTTAPRLLPWGTAATPMVMPLAHIAYGDDQTALYGTLHPLVTADGAVIPARSESAFTSPVPAPVVPAGRP